MTSYIDNAEASRPAVTDAGPSGPDTPSLPTVLPGLITLWTLPLSAFHIWADNWTKLLTRNDPETDRDQSPDQLPVPNPLQQDKDRELFA
ncbi:MAG: hypothetical protein QM690_13850 [Sphingobium sp.]